jgi:hypothetical protein
MLISATQRTVLPYLLLNHSLEVAAPLLEIIFYFNNDFAG